MKIRTILISAAVSAAAIGGIGYGVYCSMQGKKTPVEVVPVSNVNNGFWGDSESIYGTITSQVSQIINLKDEYPIEEIFVSEGDSVSEGTPLFSYDMTLPELELEMEELTLQTYKLTLARLEKDLGKLKNGIVTASLTTNEFQMTASADTEDVIMETTPNETDPSGESEAAGQSAQDSAGIQIDGIETVDRVPDAASAEEETNTEAEAQDASVTSSVAAYEQLVSSIEALFDSYEDEIKSSDIAAAVRSAVKYYRKHLADQKIEQQTDENGKLIEVISYEIKASVKEALDDKALAELEAYSQKMDAYQKRYVELLIEEASAVAEKDLPATIAIMREEFNYLPTAQQKSLRNLQTYEAYLLWDEQRQEQETESETELESGKESESETEIESGKESESETEIESEKESESETEMENDSEDLAVAVTDFLTKAEVILMEGAQPTKEMYLAAIDLYQQFLAVPQADVADLELNAKMEEYVLTEAARTYLNMQSESAAQETEDMYQQLCLAYVRFLITRMDSHALMREELTEAQEAYEMLGLVWQGILEQKWQEEQAQQETTGVVASLLDHLTAYDMILSIQELDLNRSKKEIKADLRVLKEKYLSFSDAQKNLVWNRDELIALLMKYKLWDIETETESETEDFGDDWDNWGDDWEEGGYTAEELAELIKDKEREIQECQLNIRESEIAVRKKQRVVDGKVVKSTMDGTVISIGDSDGSSENDYFAKIANDKGLYARGSMNELSLEKIKVGDTISGVTLDEGISFTAVIKEISEYPESGNSGYYSYGDENTNASYYPFYALIDDSEGISQGEAEIQFSETMSNQRDAIYLELYFVREDSNGASYVMIKGEDGLLKKQIIETGKVVSNYAVEIVSGLTLQDQIAFPYGDDVFEGAQTKDVDMLQAAYN